MSTYYAVVRNDKHLKHHGIKGQKWGIRRFQNLDGSWTAAGKARRQQESGQLKDYVNKDGSLTDLGKKKYKRYVSLEDDKEFIKRYEAACDESDKACEPIVEKYNKLDDQLRDRYLTPALNKSPREYDKAYNVYYKKRLPIFKKRNKEMKEQQDILRENVNDIYVDMLDLSSLSREDQRELLKKYRYMESDEYRR